MNFMVASMQLQRINGEGGGDGGRMEVGCPLF